MQVKGQVHVSNEGGNIMVRGIFLVFQKASILFLYAYLDIMMKSDEKALFLKTVQYPVSEERYELVLQKVCIDTIIRILDITALLPCSLPVLLRQVHVEPDCRPGQPVRGQPRPRQQRRAVFRRGVAHQRPGKATPDTVVDV